MSTWLLIDGFNLAYRCFFAIPELTRSDGFPTNALHGWVKTIWKLEDQEKADGILVFFDLGGAQDRLALLPDYKAQREEMPEALSQQIPVIKELTRLMGLGGIEIEGVESDDLLAAQAVALANDGHTVKIVSADKDFAQTVTDNISMLLPPPSANPRLGWRAMGPAEVVTKFGVTPDKIADYLALVGDAADNIPGVAGVGPKTASKWLNEHGSLEGVIANAAVLKPDRFRLIVAADADRLRINLQLTTFNPNLPVQPAVKPPADGTSLVARLRELEMKSATIEAERRYGASQGELF
ncbi:5'-3' exonuclease [Synoicihabitans lomoniglobus]|uniref:5'-3' exonuclease H3TH domain-containing protein n=1 Tax=Synoicihabitans lomoniglobus TaxID=2909285 RepID=A0AAF0CRC7_9BACT|nr:5'-3' exonuclease [Opitutaceae bacterium LMO-M01]WED66653.1 5'-3' exonuclease H3TH domain-containing protein [Opitutaceae bacterium LMO-M01]